jgi:hypothetical protein
MPLRNVSVDPQSSGRRMFLGLGGSVLAALLLATWTVVFTQVAGLAELNPGWHFGYYGNHNRAVDRAAAMEGVTIVRAWCHEDLTLEDSFVGLTWNGRKIYIEFYWSTFNSSGLDFDDLFEGWPERFESPQSVTSNGVKYIDPVYEARFGTAR